MSGPEPRSAKRTQLYLPHSLFESAERVARERGTSVAGVVREALAAYLAETGTSRPGPSWEDDPIWRAVGKVKSRDGDLAARHDDYLYGPIRS